MFGQGKSILGILDAWSSLVRYESF